MTVNYNFTVTEGHTKSFVLRWESLPFVRKPIIGITVPAGAPRIEVTGHGMKNGWRCAVCDAKGITKINADVDLINDPQADSSSEFHKITVLDADHFELNELSLVNPGTHTPNTGYILYLTPVTLTNHTQRMRVRDREGGKLLVCTQAGTSGATKPTGPGADGTVVWAAGSPDVDEKVWVAGADYALGDVVDVSIIASSDAADTPLDILSITTDATNFTITPTLSAAATVALAGKTGYYCVEDFSDDATPVVTQLAYGTITTKKE